MESFQNPLVVLRKQLEKFANKKILEEQVINLTIFDQQTKLPNDSFDWFLQNQQTILLEGNPGTGKSTLAWHLYQQWAQGLIWNKLKLVFMIEISQLKILIDQEKPSFDQLIIQQLDLNQTMRQATIQQIIRQEQKDILIILEGYDEIQHTINDSPKFLEMITRIIDRNSFILSTSNNENEAKLEYHVLITSRPSDNVSYNPTKRLTIKGFDDKSIKQYIITNHFDNLLEEKGFKLYSLLQFKPIFQLCSNPQTLNMICNCYKQNEVNKKFSTNLSLIYQQAIVNTIDQLSNGTNKISLIQNLSKIAYDQISNETDSAGSIMISKKDIEINLSDDIIQYLSLKQKNHLQIFRSILNQKLEQSDLFSFSHLTLQEWLASYYLFQDFEKLKQEIQMKFYESKYRQVWIFLCGLLNKKQLEVFLYNYIEKFQQTEELSGQGFKTFLKCLEQIKREVFVEIYDQNKKISEFLENQLLEAKVDISDQLGDNIYSIFSHKIIPNLKKCRKEAKQDVSKQNFLSKWIRRVFSKLGQELENQQQILFFLLKCLDIESNHHDIVIQAIDSIYENCKQISPNSNILQELADSIKCQCLNKILIKDILDKYQNNIQDAQNLLKIKNASLQILTLECIDESYLIQVLDEYIENNYDDLKNLRFSIEVLGKILSNRQLSKNSIIHLIKLDSLIYGLQFTGAKQNILTAIASSHQSDSIEILAWFIDKMKKEKEIQLLSSEIDAVIKILIDFKQIPNNQNENILVYFIEQFNQSESHPIFSKLLGQIKENQKFIQLYDQKINEIIDHFINSTQSEELILVVVQIYVKLKIFRKNFSPDQFLQKILKILFNEKYKNISNQIQIELQFLFEEKQTLSDWYKLEFDDKNLLHKFTEFLKTLQWTNEKEIQEYIKEQNIYRSDSNIEEKQLKQIFQKYFNSSLLIKAKFFEQALAFKIITPSELLDKISQFEMNFHRQSTNFEQLIEIFQAFDNSYDKHLEIQQFPFEKTCMILIDKITPLEADVLQKFNPIFIYLFKFINRNIAKLQQSQVVGNKFYPEFVETFRNNFYNKKNKSDFFYKFEELELQILTFIGEGYLKLGSQSGFLIIQVIDLFKISLKIRKKGKNNQSKINQRKRYVQIHALKQLEKIAICNQKNGDQEIIEFLVSQLKNLQSLNDISGNYIQCIASILKKKLVRSENNLQFEQLIKIINPKYLYVLLENFDFVTNANNWIEIAFKISNKELLAYCLKQCSERNSNIWISEKQLKISGIIQRAKEGFELTDILNEKVIKQEIKKLEE